MAELQPIMVFHCRYFVRHPGICNWICVNILQQMSSVITYNSVEKRSLHINKWLSYSQIYCFTAAILSAILEFIIRFVSNTYRLCPVSFRGIHKNTTSLSHTVFLAPINAAYTHAQTDRQTDRQTDTPTHTTIA